VINLEKCRGLKHHDEYASAAGQLPFGTAEKWLSVHK